MYTPVVGLFSEAPAEAISDTVLLLLTVLLERGCRVILVDADPGSAPLAPFWRPPAPRDVQVTDVQGTDAPPPDPGPPPVSFLGLLRDPEARPLLLDLGPRLRDDRTPAHAGVWMVPALAAGELADPELLRAPPLQGSRRYLALRTTLSMLDADLVLLVGPRGRGELAVSLLAHGCHAAMLFADSTALEVMALALTARNAEARRGGLLPTTCVEMRDHGVPVPEGAWQQLWRTHPGHLPPERRGEQGPERLLVLDDEPQCTDALVSAVLDLAERGRAEDPEPDSRAFGALYQESRDDALALFRQHIAPRLGTRSSAIASLQAVWDSPERRLEDVHQLAKFAVQKLRWEDPGPDAEPLLPIFQALADAADRGELPGARALLDLAGLLAAVANWRQLQGEDVGGLAEQVEQLLRRAEGLERTAGDHGYLAEVLGYHARLTGSARHYNWALKELRAATRAEPNVRAFRRTTDVAADFAHADPGLWQIVLDLCEGVAPMDRRYALYNSAIAHAHLGQPEAALNRLLDLASFDRESFILAYADPSLRPLWEGGGYVDALQAPRRHPRGPSKPRKPPNSR